MFQGHGMSTVRVMSTWFLPLPEVPTTREKRMWVTGLPLALARVVGTSVFQATSAMAVPVPVWAMG